MIQADLTAVASGPLSHAVAADLRLLADQESRGAAAVFRFSSNPGVRTVAFSVPIQPMTAFAITTEAGPFGGEHPTTSPLLMGSPQPPRPGSA